MIELIKIGKIIDPVDFFPYIEEAEKLETVVHKYGSKFEIPSYPCWMEYKNEAKVIGSISFTRHTYQHPILREMVDKIVSLYTPIFPESEPPIPERVHIIRTTGSIPIHKDEAGRMSCINLGVQNSSGAKTFMSVDGIFENFTKNNEVTLIEDGCAYLMNTNQWHSVSTINGEPRYLITYGFEKPFHVIREKLRF